MNKPNYPALAAIAAALLCTAFPWIGVENVNLQGGKEELINSISLSGYQSIGGLIGIPVCLLGAYLAFKGEKIAMAAGLVNLGLALLHILDKIGFQPQSSGFIEMRVLHLSGLYAFAGASLIFSVLCMMNLGSAPQGKNPS